MVSGYGVGSNVFYGRHGIPNSRKDKVGVFPLSKRSAKRSCMVRGAWAWGSGAAAAAGRGGVQPPASAPAAINLWGLSGRQAMMQMRNQMQMRGFHGARLR